MYTWLGILFFRINQKATDKGDDIDDYLHQGIALFGCKGQSSSTALPIEDNKQREKNKEELIFHIL